MPTMMSSSSVGQQQQQQYAASSPSYGTGAQHAQMPSYAPAPAAQPKGRSLVLPIVGGLLLVLLLVGGVGAFFVIRSMGGSSETKTDTKSQGIGTTDSKDASTTPAANMKEAIRYALDVEQTKGGDVVRVAGIVPLASKQAFKFNFTPQEDGYLYIVGPGPGNVPMTFLTAKPVKQSGVKTNEVTAGEDYVFPDGDGNWITLDENPGTEDYTVIFSKTPLEEPSFLASLAGLTLSEEQQSEFYNFVGKYKANGAKPDVSQAEAADPFVSIKVPEGRADDQPVIFTVRIEHK